MSHFYVACDFKAGKGRVMLGNLHKDKLVVSEVNRFENQPVQEKDGAQWNIAEIYEETMSGLRAVGKYEEPIDGISCTSWPGDYMLFEADGSLIAPTYRHCQTRAQAGKKKVLSKLPAEALYDETGVQDGAATSIFQLATEKSRRLSRARHMIPVADGFNFLLGGVPRVDVTMASSTHLYNPSTKRWSDKVLNALSLPSTIMPSLVRPGSDLGPLKADIARDTGIEDARIVTSCSHEIAAALAGLPIGPYETWAFLQSGRTATMGTEVREPIINDLSRRLGFTNEAGYDDSVRFHKPAIGLWILDECRRFWKEKDRDMDADLLNHLAASSPPLESLINPSDPRFATPGDMPLKIQAYCRETGQAVPRKPGQIARCVLESLALHYRKTLHELEAITSTRINRLYILGGTANSLLNHFTANALEIPVVVAHPDAAAIGNLVVQAVALGHLKSLEEARELVNRSFKTERIVPHATAWNAAYDRLVSMVPA